MQEHGTVIGAGTIRFERLLPGPIERIWTYLTDSEKRGRWLATGEMELHPGGRVELRFHHADLSPVPEEIPDEYAAYQNGASIEGRVTRCDPPRVLSYTWGEEGGRESEVTFELTPRNDRVLLVLTHRRLDEGEELISVISGWHTHLSVLTSVLAAEVPDPFWTTHARIESDYRSRLQLTR